MGRHRRKSGEIASSNQHSPLSFCSVMPFLVAIRVLIHRGAQATKSTCRCSRSTQDLEVILRVKSGNRETMKQGNKVTRYQGIRHTGARECISNQPDPVTKTFCSGFHRNYITMYHVVFDSDVQYILPSHVLQSHLDLTAHRAVKIVDFLFLRTCVYILLLLLLRIVNIIPQFLDFQVFSFLFFARLQPSTPLSNNHCHQLSGRQRKPRCSSSPPAKQWSSSVPSLL